MEKFKKMENSLLLGVTGGIASGKSTVSGMLEKLGAPLIDFDLVAREVVRRKTPTFDAVVDFFGKNILDDKGELDRKKLSEIVFSDINKRKKLESLTHPAIFKEASGQIKNLAEKGRAQIIQAAAPLLIESNMQDMFEKILLVYIPPHMQTERLSKRDRISPAEAGNILKSQLPIDEKIKHADFVIDNRGSLEETKKRVEEFWEELKKQTSPVSNL